MSYIDKKRLNGEIYNYFVKKVSFMKKLLVIKKSLGKNSISINKEKYLLDNIESINREELTFREKFLEEIKDKISYNDKLPENIELKAINIGNLIEGKNCEKIIENEFATEFIFNSNNIEGSKIPPEKVREIIETGNTKYKDKNEIKEVENSIQAYEYIKKGFKFNIVSIKRLYHILTNNLLMEKKFPYPSGFKKVSNIVGNSPTTSPEDVESELSDLIKWYLDNRRKIHPLILAFEFHRRYEFIHPFLDGNGRTGRMIMNKILISNGYPPIIVFKKNKIAYFRSIEKSKEGKIKNYYHFMTEQTNKSYDFILKVIRKY